jgi:acetyltransferase-like isoleucine patch superfamily enzyme
MALLILPGITIDEESITGARFAVTNDAALSSIVAGMPADFLRWRLGYVEEEDHGNKE